MPNNDNLLSKARKRIIQGLSAIMTVAMLTSCQPKVPDKTDDPTHETGGNGGQTNNGGTTNGGSTSNGGTTENKYKDYSELFQYFMNECNGERYFGNKKYIGEIEFENLNLPFSFLSSVGYSDSDIADIKKSRKYADCTTAIMDNEPNSLYMFIRVAVEDYYDMYTIKYAMTDQEIAEYEEIHPFNYYTNAGTVYNDVISKFKEATIVGHCKMSKEVVDLMSEKSLYGSMIVYGFDPESQLANIFVYRNAKGCNDKILNRDIIFESLSNLSYTNGVIRSEAIYGGYYINFINFRDPLMSETFNFSRKSQDFQHQNIIELQK